VRSFWWLNERNWSIIEGDIGALNFISLFFSGDAAGVDDAAGEVGGGWSSTTG
jgi:hypothetical protein